MINTLKNKSIPLVRNSEEILRTNSYWFLMPMLNIKKADLLVNGIINCYLDDNLNNMGYENHLHLLFKHNNKNFEKFNDFLDKLSHHPLYVDLYDTEGYGDVIVVFKIPEEFEKILNLFKKGKYSEFSQQYKVTFFQRKDTDGSLTKEWKILNKHEDLRKITELKTNEVIPEEWEVWDKPIAKEEIYMYNEFILNKYDE